MRSACVSRVPPRETVRAAPLSLPWAVPAAKPWATLSVVAAFSVIAQCPCDPFWELRVRRAEKPICTKIGASWFPRATLCRGTPDLSPLWGPAWLGGHPGRGGAPGLQQGELAASSMGAEQLSWDVECMSGLPQEGTVALRVPSEALVNYRRSGSGSWAMGWACGPQEAGFSLNSDLCLGRPEGPQLPPAPIQHPPRPPEPHPAPPSLTSFGSCREPAAS